MERRVEPPKKCEHCKAVGSACCVAAANLADDVEKLKDERERAVFKIGELVGILAEIVAADEGNFALLRESWHIDENGVVTARVGMKDSRINDHQDDVVALVRTILKMKTLAKRDR